MTPQLARRAVIAGHDEYVRVQGAHFGQLGVQMLDSLRLARQSRAAGTG